MRFTKGIILAAAGLVMVMAIAVKAVSNLRPGAATPGRVSGLVIPHHETANDLVIRALDKIKSSQSPKYAVVFCPNHFRPQSPTFISSEIQTGYPVAREIISGLIKEYPQLVIDDALVAGEHGTNTPIKILQAAFPQARYVPLLVSPHFNREDLQKMALSLTAIMPRDTLYIASVDFSHNQLAEDAMQYDSQTVNAIQNFDYEKLYGFTDDNLDSPASMATLLMIMEQVKTTHWEAWEESHGALLTGNPSLTGTSYVTGVFR